MVNFKREDHAFSLSFVVLRTLYCQ